MLSHAPSASKTRKALPWSEMPEPSALSSGLDSKTSTSTPAFCTAVMSEPLCSRGIRGQKIATGLIGEPTAPVMGRGGAERRKSHFPRAAQEAASSSRSHISPIVSPRFGITTWCSGWNDGTSNSLGRTSKPQVSVAIAAISVRCSQPAVVSERPAAGPPAYSPQPSRRARVELARADRVAVGELARLGCEVTSQIQQHSARDHDGCRMLDARDQVALARDDIARAPAVPGDAVVEDVAQSVPLRRALQRHRDHVV